MFTYLLTGSFGEYFLFYGLAKFFIYIALAWRHRYFLSKILFRFFTWSLASDPTSSHGDLIFKNSSSPGVWHETLFTATSVLKLIFLFPISTYEKGSYFRFRILANHYPFFFLSLVTECKHLLTFILTWIYYLGHEELTYITIPLFNGQPLTAY